VKNVLIIGNGISRLDYSEEIKNFDGEIWSCNYAFREFGEILDRITGHREPMEECLREKKNKGWKVKVFSSLINPVPECENFTIDRYWLRDSGTSLVVQAIKENFDNIYVAGFDLGGADVHSPNHWMLDKTVWVRRWAEIFQKFTLDKIIFIGHDHSDFIKKVSKNMQNAGFYSENYLRKVPHINNEKYKEIHKKYVKQDDNKLVKVKYISGHECFLRLEIAKRLLMRGQIEVINGLA